MPRLLIDRRGREIYAIYTYVTSGWDVAHRLQTSRGAPCVGGRCFPMSSRHPLQLVSWTTDPFVGRAVNVKGRLRGVGAKAGAEPRGAP